MRPLDPQSSALPTAPHPDVFLLILHYLLYHINHKMSNLDFISLMTFFIFNIGTCSTPLANQSQGFILKPKQVNPFIDVARARGNEGGVK